MKTINAYLNVKNFTRKMEIIETAIRTSKGVEQLNSIKDFLVTAETLSIAESLGEIAKCFKKESVENREEEFREMFNNWGMLISDKTEAATSILNLSDALKKIIQTQTAANGKMVKDKDLQSIKESNGYMLKGITIFIQDFKCLPVAVNIFETYVMPNMSVKELQPEVETEINLN